MRLAGALLAICLLAGCETGIVVHDENRAAELIVDCLSSFKTDQGRRLAYAWTDDRFKEQVSYAEFSRFVLSIRDENRGADIELAGFEIFGPVETLVVYADSELEEGKLYFKFTLSGSRSSDYYLSNLSTSTSGFDKEGVYREYEDTIVVEGV